MASRRRSAASTLMSWATSRIRGLYELRSALTIPVTGVGEATLLAASQLGRRLGLVTLDQAFEVWHYEQADRYGLSGRVVHVTGMGCSPADFSAAFAGDAEAKARMLRDFTACAQPLLERGADVIIPAGVLPGLLIASEHGFKIGHAPVVNCAAVALKSAEMWVQLQRLNGTEPSRGPSFALANGAGRAGFFARWSRVRTIDEPRYVEHTTGTRPSDAKHPHTL